MDPGGRLSDKDVENFIGALAADTEPGYVEMLRRLKVTEGQDRATMMATFGTPAVRAFFDNRGKKWTELVAMPDDSSPGGARKATLEDRPGRGAQSPQQQPSGAARGAPLGDSPDRASQRMQQLMPAIESAARRADLNPAAMAHMIAGESGGKPGITNQLSGKHAGLIQFSRETWDGLARQLGTPHVSWENMRAMSAEQQMPYVAQFFKNAGVGPDDGPEEYNLAGFWPVALKGGWADSAVIGRKGDTGRAPGSNLQSHKVWAQNPGLRDPSNPDVITVASAKTRGKRGSR
jgi:hypothetical protein